MDFILYINEKHRKCDVEQAYVFKDKDHPNPLPRPTDPILEKIEIAFPFLVFDNTLNNIYF